jgi:hypothetical protein
MAISPSKMYENFTQVIAKISAADHKRANAQLVAAASFSGEDE